jgi:mannose-6-phosphate isomerase
VYPAQVDDFRLSRLVLEAQDDVRTLSGAGPQILVCTEGTIRLTGPDGVIALDAGGSAYVPAREQVTVSGSGTLFRATTAHGEEELNRN